MNDKDSKGSSGTTAIIIVVAVLLLGLPCLAVVGLFGAGMILYRAQAVPSAADPQPMAQESPPIIEPPAPAESAVPAPTEVDPIG